MLLKLLTVVIYDDISIIGVRVCNSSSKVWKLFWVENSFLMQVESDANLNCTQPELASPLLSTVPDNRRKFSKLYRLYLWKWMQTDCFYVAFLSLTMEQFAFVAVSNRKWAKREFGRNKQFRKKYVLVGRVAMLRKNNWVGKIDKIKRSIISAFFCQ